VDIALRRDHANFSLTGQLHQLPELVPVAHEAPEDGEFGEDHIDGFHAQRPAIADDDQGPTLVKHLHPVRKGQVVPHEVDHDVGTAIPGDVHDLLHGIPAAVGGDPGEHEVLAMHVLSDSAWSACTVRDDRMHDDLLAFLEGSHGVADLLDHAGVFVAQGVRQVHLDLLPPNAFHDM